MYTRLRSREEMEVTGIIVGYSPNAKTRTFPICKEVIFMFLYIEYLINDTMYYVTYIQKHLSHFFLTQQNLLHQVTIMELTTIMMVNIMKSTITSLTTRYKLILPVITFKTN